MIFGLRADLLPMERKSGFRENYPGASAAKPGLSWQTECNAQYLPSFKHYEAVRTFLKAGRAKLSYGA